VGHETDVTIADFAADLRAPTPSAAAELIAPDFSEMQRRAALAEERLFQAIRFRLESARDDLRALLSRPPFARPFEGIHRRRQELDDAEDHLRALSAHTLERERLRLAGLAGRLQALSPLAVLARGYSVVTRHPEGTPVRSRADVGAGDEIRVQTRDGAFDARVTEAWRPDGGPSPEEKS
jgi:exodeoxyribonuclease VII large subunit